MVHFAFHLLNTQEVFKDFPLWNRKYHSTMDF